VFNFLDVTFPTLSVPLTRGYSLMSTHAKYEHELMTIRFIDWNTSYDSISDGTPVVVKINGIGSNRTFNGYVHHIVPDISPDKNYVDITLIGASKVFKQQSQKVWVNSTADQVIADICKSNNFSYVATPHKRVYDQISQTGMSDWELMVKLAKQSGYSLKADNTTVYFQPVTQEFTDSRQQASYYVLHGLNEKATGIYSFKPFIGESMPYEDARKTTVAVGGVNRESKISHVQTNQKTVTKTRSKSVSPIYDAYHTHVVAPTYEIAQFEATAADELNRYPYRGEVVIQGNPTILPDSPLFLDGLGKVYSGFWTALSVSHNIKGNAEYTTTVLVGADSLGTSSQWIDNKNINYPNESVQRVITPGIKQKNVLPKTSLQQTGNSVKESLKTPFSRAKNVSKTLTAATPTYQWVGVGGNLKAPLVQEKTMPPAVLAKIRSAHAI
jgi:phage protein D